MKTSKKGIDLIKEFESLHDGDLTQIGLQPKMCPAGVWTEGYGHAIRDAKGNFVKGKLNKALAYSLAKIKTVEDAERVLAVDLSVFEVVVSRKVHRLISQNQFDALVSHTMNTGGSSTTFDMVNDMNTKPEVLRQWWENHYLMGNGIVLPGLIRRRKAEVKLYLNL